MKADIDYKRKDKKMKLGNKKKFIVTGMLCMAAGIAGLIFGNNIMTGVPIIGALTAVAGFIMLVLGKLKEDECGPAEPVQAPKKFEVAKKADKPAKLAGYIDHEGIYHGV